MMHVGVLFRSCLLIAIMLLVFASHIKPSYSTESQSDYRFVINVYFSDKKSRINISGLKDKYVVYYIKVKKGTKQKYRARIGFFQSRKIALSLLDKVKKTYSHAWLDTVKQYDKPARSKWFTSHGEQKKPTFSQSSLQMGKKETSRVMGKAAKMVAVEKYPEAIKLYTKIISRGYKQFRQDALEYLGATREKNGQYAHAKAEYKEYLRLYPEGEGAERVRMRLNSMLLARAKPRRKLQKSKTSRKSRWVNYGYLTEFYRYDNLKVNETSIERKSSTSSLGLFSRRKSDTSDIKMEFTGSYLYDMKDSDDSRRRLTSLYIDYANRPKTTSIRLGRQSHTRSGVLGRMDGVWADYQFHPQWKFNVVAGYPVNLFDTNKVQKNRKFYGYSLDIGPYNQYWDFNIFKIEQEVDGITDREAMGGEVRYVSPGKIFFTLIDYDTYFDDLNKIYIVSTWRFNGQSSLNITFDKGKSPYLLSTNALQGQTYSSIGEMRADYTESEIRQIAIDRTAEVTTARIGGTIPLSKDFSFNMDFTITNISGTPESAGVAGTQSTGDEYFYGAQFIGNNVLKKNDTLVIGIRYSDSSTYNRTSFSVSERMKLSNKWRTSFGLYLESSDKTNGAQTEKYKPSVGIDYLYSRMLRLEADLQYEQSTTDGDTLPTETEGVYFSAGIIYDF